MADCNHDTSFSLFFSSRSWCPDSVTRVEHVLLFALLLLICFWLHLEREDDCILLGRRITHIRRRNDKSIVSERKAHVSTQTCTHIVHPINGIDMRSLVDTFFHPPFILRINLSCLVCVTPHCIHQRVCILYARECIMNPVKERREKASVKEGEEHSAAQFIDCLLHRFLD